MLMDGYVDPDLIAALYADPQNEILLAEYTMRTGGIQMGVISATGGGGGGLSSGGMDGGGSVLGVIEIRGQGGGEPPLPPE